MEIKEEAFYSREVLGFCSLGLVDPSKEFWSCEFKQISASQLHTCEMDINPTAGRV